MGSNTGNCQPALHARQLSHYCYPVSKGVLRFLYPLVRWATALQRRTVGTRGRDDNDVRMSSSLSETILTLTRLRISLYRLEHDGECTARSKCTVEAVWVSSRPSVSVDWQLAIWIVGRGRRSRPTLSQPHAN